MVAAGGSANAQWTGFYVGAMGEVIAHNNVDFSNTGYFALSSTGSSTVPVGNA
jgi:hypothetical protein